MAFSMLYSCFKIHQKFKPTFMKTVMSSPPRKKRKFFTKLTAAYEVPLPQPVFTSARNLMMITGSCYLPNKSKLKPFGQDAHFTFFGPEQTIGVADGVGDCAKKGTGSGIYVRELMDNARFAIQEKPIGAVDPKQVLIQAFLNTKAKGASTACSIVTLKNNFLHAVNLGDSGFVVIREGKIVYRSPIQRSWFNCPFQLRKCTEYIPEIPEEIVVQVEPGDVLVAATDGLFDNVYPEEIEDIVKECVRKGKPPELMASNLVKFARKQSLCKYSITPLTEAAMDIGLEYKNYRGGKKDDVTVIVGCIF